MSLRIYNTATRRKEDFVPREPGKVALYVCGPTVYNYIHIGNARTFLSFDAVRRYLRWRGYEVIFVQNITDIDDKIINRAAEEGKTPAEIAAYYTEAFITEMRALGVEDPTLRPRATDSIADMIALIERLIARGHAYESDGDVYFAVRSWPGYGELSGRALDELQSGARVAVSDVKRDPLDFTLWKAAKPGEPFWDSPWGAGRPGWHTECSAMSERDLGLPVDIHGGGGDLVFPHHENERAQAEAATGLTFVNYWMHGGMLNINDEKMSKSLGNFLLLRDVLERYEPAVLRLLMLQTHYRSPLDFSDARLEEAASALGRLRGFVEQINWRIGQSSLSVGSDSGSDVGRDAPGAPPAEDLAQTARQKFRAEMDDDFNTAGALAALFELTRATNIWLDARPGELDEGERAGLASVGATITELLGVLGIDLANSPGADASDDASSAEAERLLEERTAARAAKDWARADALRDELDTLGYAIKDTPQGPQLARK